MNSVQKLFIIHTANMTGGGSQSIRELIQNLDEKIDLLVNIDHRVNSSALKKFYGKNVRKIYRFHLPFRRSALGLKLEKNAAKEWIDREREYLRDKKKIYDLIRRNKYHFIHLNSYVLYPLISSRFPMYIHIREIFEGNFMTRKIVNQRLRQARGIFYIDYAVKESFGVCNKKEIVLNNPFDQSAVLGVDKENVLNSYHLQGNRTILTFVSARFDEIKGFDYVIEEFVCSNCSNAELVVVGSNAPQKYKQIPNVHFLGRIQNMEEIYAISDFVVRGDIIFAVGRTTYEALYSGCHVMVPGNKDTDKAKLFEYDAFEDRIMFYEPRKKGALAGAMKSVDGKKKEKCLGLSNETEYVRQFLQFVEGGRKQ